MDCFAGLINGPDVPHPWNTVKHLLSNFLKANLPLRICLTNAKLPLEYNRCIILYFSTVSTSSVTVLRHTGISGSMNHVGKWETAILFIFVFFSTSTMAEECEIALERRVDCYPEISNLSEPLCVGRGCCYDPYQPGTDDDNVPWCFFSSNHPYTYMLTKYEKAPCGYDGELMLMRTPAPHPPKALPILKLSIFLEKPDRLHFKITDANNTRYQVPIDVPKITDKTNLTLKYKVETSPLFQAFYLSITRVDTDVKLFDTRSGPLLFGDQFLQISTTLASSNIYGLGERHGSLRPSTYWHRIPFWAADHPPGFPEGGNLYGDHPFYLVVEPDGNSHGVFFLNSNAKEAELQPEPALTWRSIGGIMDFYIFLGPTPDQVVQQYTDVIGRPYMPPMWSLGYHLCRWGYMTANNTLSYVEKMRLAKIPQDVQWNDIDYMSQKLDFTYNHADFDKLPELVSNLHSHGQHYVMIVDPGISDQQTRGSYAPYDDAIQMGVLVADVNSKQPVHGKVWPGGVVFPDFTNPSVADYWRKQLSVFHSAVPFDGVWIDMNELSNFMDGAPPNCYKNSFDYPPYVPRVTGGKLFSNTICPSSLQYLSNNYNVHSLTGLMEMKATSNAMTEIRKKRPFVISRSTFPSAGKYGGHWTGDIKSTWEHMKLTIPGILGFNMFGIPLVGADICGFGGSTTEELCIRWSQLGAFYPFSRNHNDIAGAPQAPVDFSKNTQDIIKDALNVRYSLLPYLYTLFHYSNTKGSTVARPLFFEYPLDENTYSIDAQFLWGSALMISPVLEPASKKVNAYFPSGIWYDIYMDKGKPISSAGRVVGLEAPLESIPLHIRGGHIIPCSIPGTVINMTTDFYLLVAAGEYGKAAGTLFWDDGDSLDTYPVGEFVLIGFTLSNNTLYSQLVDGSKDMSQKLQLNMVYIFGVRCHANDVKVNGKSVLFSIDNFGNIIVKNLPSLIDLVLTWTCSHF